MPHPFPTTYHPFDERGVVVAVKKHPRGFDYLEGHYVIDVLNSVFPLRWSFEVLGDLRQEPGRYSARGRLTVYPEGRTVPVVHEDIGVGTYTGEPQKEKAEKEAVTDCLKRCARQLGWQFGNSLYDDGPWEHERRAPSAQAAAAPVRPQPRAPYPVRAGA